MKKHTLKNKILKGWSLQVIICTALLLSPFLSVFPHGTVTNPPSRVWNCFQELTTGVSNQTTSPACTAAVIGWGTQAFYDWSEVARMDANDMHRDIIMDGNLASAGRPDKFGGLDQARSDWIATDVTPGPFTLTWTNSAPHVTLYYEVYITKADWTPDQPLTWDNIELVTRTGPRPASATDNIDLVLPQRTGKHVLYSIWQRSLTAEAFYSTSDVDFGASTDPVAPVAAFTSDNGECGGPEVAFSAADSYDANGDDLTYAWDFGDGTTAEGLEVSHTYTTGEEDATVMLTVSDGTFSSGVTNTIGNLIEDPACTEVPEVAAACAFDTPRSSAMPIMYYRSYNKSQGGSITVIGDNGPDLTPIRKLDIAYTNNEVNTFFLNEWSADQGFGGNGANVNPTIDQQTFNQVNSEFTISNTGIDNFDGSYYVTAIENEEFGSNFADFVMVSKTGGFSIYFTYSSEAPDCEGEDGPTTPEVTVDGGTLSGGPFEFIVNDGIVDNVSGVSVSGNIGDNSQWLVTDDSGNILGLPENIEAVDFDIAEEGRCFIYNLSYNGEIGGLAVNNNISTLTGEFDFSNAIDVIRNTETTDGPEVTFEDVVYNEAVDGALSGDNNATTLITLAPGDNRIISSQTGVTDQANFFTFQIPEGYEFAQLVVDSYQGTDDIGFIGLDEGNVISGAPTSNAPSRLIGGLSYGTANVGTDILPIMGDLSNPAAGFIAGFGFTAPLVSGEYTIWLNQTGGLSTTVLNIVLTATDDPETSDCNFGTESSLPTTYESYDYAYVIGTGGPNLTTITKLTISWSSVNNGLYQFAFHYNESPWYKDFSSSTQSFNQTNPTISLSGSGITGLDGDYSVTTDEVNFVMVADGYTIYFSNSATAPDCEGETTGAKNIEELAFLNMFPNPASTSVTLQNNTDLKGSLISIVDLSGKELKSLALTKSTTNKTIDISGIETGLYLVIISDADGFSKRLKLIVE